jgi:hypothetical protein
MVTVITEQTSEFRTKTDKFMVAQVAKKFPQFIKQGISLHCLHQPTIGHDSKPDKPSLHSYILLYLFIIHFNIVLRAMFV